MNRLAVLVFLSTFSAINAECPRTVSALCFNVTACPRIVTKAEWGGRPPAASPEPMDLPLPYVVVHHGGTKTYCTNQTECAKIVRAYQNYHMDSNKWNDIGYNFLVGEDGAVYEGRGWTSVGAHAPTFNVRSIGVCVIGDFTDRVPNAAAQEAVKGLIACGVETGIIEKDYGLIGHRQNPASNTVCPGQKFYELITNWPHWTATPDDADMGQLIEDSILLYYLSKV